MENRDVYKRQYHHILDTVVGAHTLHGALAHVEHLRRLCRVKPVSYTHLDVYKRQSESSVPRN